jgi:subtilisin family serine protease
MSKNLKKKILLIFLLVLTFSFVFAQNNIYKNEVIVFYKNAYNLQSIKGLSIKKIKNNIAVLKVPEGKTVENTIKELKKDPSVALVIPNYIIKKQTVPNDSLYQYQWYLKKINIENAWDLSTGSKDVYIAVLDTGVDYNHPDLKNNIWLNTGETLGIDNNKNGIDDGCENGIDDDGDGYVDDCYGYNAIAGKGSALDDDGHGTHVSGIIGAVGNNSIGIAGINWNVKIIPCKFLDASGNGDLNGLLECLQYIKTIKEKYGLNIVVVNESLGYDGNISQLNIDCSNPNYQNTEKCLMKSIDALFTIAAGNTNDNNDNNVFLPCNYSTVLDNVICVGSTNSSDNKSSFSNYGFNIVNIFAPGGELVSSNNCDTSNEILSTWIGNDYTCAVGTSQAAPVVAGVIGLLKASNPILTLNDIKVRILTTGDNLLSLSGYSLTCNRINAFNALSDEKSPKICINQKIWSDSNGYFYNTNNLKAGDTVSFIIKNTGNEILQIGKISLQNGTDFNITFDNCSYSNLNTFSSCEFKLYVNSDNPFEDVLIIPTNTVYNTIQIRLKSNVITQSTPKNNGGGCSIGHYNNSLTYILVFIAIVLIKRIKEKNKKI